MAKGEQVAKNKLVITAENNVVYYGYYCDGVPVELYCEKKEAESLLGNIYAARVQRVAEGIGGAFLEIADGQKCYYPLPKDGTKPVKLSPGHENKLCGGDIILVQIVKDAVKTKLPVADGNVSLTGKYFVLTMSDRRSGISKKIMDAEVRERLTLLMEDYISDEYGLIVRTNAAHASDEILLQELQSLQRRYQELMRRAVIAPGKTLLLREPPHYISYGKDLPETELDEIVTDQKEIYDELETFYATAGDDLLLGKLRMYADAYPLTKLYRMEHFYEKAMDKTVWLPSGGSLVIEQTEAMVVIDVNTASVTKKKKDTDLFYRMNCEAAKEIAAQLRLRNLSGMILIDFINMRYADQKEQLLRLLQKECSKDRTRTNVIDMTALNLVEMTRQKVRRPLHEQWRQCHSNKKGNI